LLFLVSREGIEIISSFGFIGIILLIIYGLKVYNKCRKTEKPRNENTQENQEEMQAFTRPIR
jgi:hypothetical protein